MRHLSALCSAKIVPLVVLLGLLLLLPGGTIFAHEANNESDATTVTTSSELEAALTQIQAAVDERTDLSAEEKGVLFDQIRGEFIESYADESASGSTTLDATLVVSAIDGAGEAGFSSDETLQLIEALNEAAAAGTSSDELVQIIQSGTADGKSVDEIQAMLEKDDDTRFAEDDTDKEHEQEAVEQEERDDDQTKISEDEDRDEDNSKVESDDRADRDDQDRENGDREHEDGDHDGDEGYESRHNDDD